jgi:hypothetical protein
MNVGHVEVLEIQGLQMLRLPEKQDSGSTLWLQDNHSRH